MGRKPKESDHKQRFLDLVRQGLTLEAAATEVGVTSRYFRQLRDRGRTEFDEAFADEFVDAWNEGAGRLIETARQRAVDGVEVMVVDRQGNEHYSRQYSDPLLMFLIKQRDPTFRENHRVELTGANGGPIQTDGEVRHVVGLTEVFELLHRVGAIRPADGSGLARAALPAAAPVLAEPPDG